MWFDLMLCADPIKTILTTELIRDAKGIEISGKATSIGLMGLPRQFWVDQRPLNPIRT